MKTIAFGIIVVLVGILTILTICNHVTNTSEMVRWYDRNAERVGKEFGFSTGTPYARFGKHVNETFTFEEVNPTGLLGNAGIKSGDIILTHFPWPTTGGLYRYLDENRGRIITISVADGGDGSPLKDRPVRTCRIKVPNNISEDIRQPADGLPKPSM